MNGLANSLVDKTVQCWGCPVFDRLFQVVSDAAGAAYGHFAALCLIVFCVLFAFYVLNAVWQNIKGGAKDPWYEKSVRTVFLNSIVALTLLGIGVAMPRFVTSITFEPVAKIALVYTQATVQTDTDTVNEKVIYQPMKMSDDGFFRPELRDTIILLMKTTITQFQSYMKLGIAVMDSAFTWDALLGVGAFIKHVILFVIGLYLAVGFLLLFIKFCFYFADIIVAMTFFAFFFPLSLVLVSFKGADAVPKWISGLGKNVGTDQFKNLINAIIALAAAVIIYTVIMVIIAKFFSAPGASSADLMQKILSGEVFAGDLNHENMAAMSLTGAVVLVYVLNFIYGQIPNVSKMVLGAFGVSDKHDLGEQLANDAMALTSATINTAKKIGETIISGGEKKDDKGK